MSAEDEAARRAAPTAGADDELLADPPLGAPPGGIQGYAAGRRLRVGIGIAVVVVLAGVAWTIKRWKDEAAEAARAPKEPDYSVLQPSELAGGDRPRKLIWNDGPARLGLSSANPGVEEIVLPDRRLRLAPGHDVAQVELVVQDGVTVKLRIVAGDVVQLPPEVAPEATAAPGSPPAP